MFGQFVHFKKAAKKFVAFFLIVGITVGNCQLGQTAIEKTENSAEFSTQAAQDYFESAAAGYLINAKKSEKETLLCLEIQPDSSWCQFLLLKIKKKSGRLVDDKEVATLLQIILTNEEDQKIYEWIRDFDLAIKTQNYSLARQVLNKLSVAVPYYPDLIILKAKLSFFSSEISEAGLDIKALNVYKRRCETIDSMTVRKFFFDLDFCGRKLEL